MPRGRPKKIKKIEEKEISEDGKKDRKVMIRELFVDLVKEHYPDEKFDRSIFIDNTGGHGILKEAIGEYYPYDRKTFLSVLDDLSREGVLYHIGGRMYKQVKK